MKAANGDRAYVEYWLGRMTDEDLLEYRPAPPLPPLPHGVVDSRADSALRIPSEVILGETFRRVMK